MEPLNLLREFTSAKRPITLKDDNLVFDKTAFARKTLTAYRSGLTGTGEFYPLDSLWFLLQQATAPHGQYVAEAVAPADPADPPDLETFSTARSQGTVRTLSG